MQKKTLLLLGCLSLLWVFSFMTDTKLNVAYAGDPNDVEFTDHPIDFRVYQRNPQTNKGTVVIAGTVDGDSYDQINVSVTRNSSPFTTVSGNVNNGFFSISIEIDAELANYDFTVSGQDGGAIDPLPAADADNVVAGDIYLINGQSNANARLRVPGDTSSSQQSPFLRTFGKWSTDAGATSGDNEWHTASGDSLSAVGFIGQWGMRMGKIIIDQEGIPVAILNGAVTSTKIKFHQRNDGDPDDLETIYGRLLWRAETAGIDDDIRAMLWYQGESDRVTDLGEYQTSFDALYNDWKADYPGLQQIYVFQVRHTALCGDENFDSPALRDLLRRLGDIYTDITLMSTTGIDPQVDGCHYPYIDGHEVIGENIARLLRRDFYGESGTNIAPPNIESAVFTKADNTEVTITTRDAADLLSFDGYTGSSEGPHLDFRLEGSSLVTATDGMIVNGNQIVLTFPQTGGNITGISYVEHKGVNPPAGQPADPNLDPRWGEWVTNSNGVGLLTFYNIAIDGFNVPPSVSLTAPTAGTFGQGTVTLQANASDSDGTIARVDFYANDAILNSDTSAPYAFDWAATAGTYTIKAVAVDNDGAETESDAVAIEVVNAPPTVAISAPAANSSLATGSAVGVMATASDSDGSVVSVQFFLNGTPLGTDNDGDPWQLTWIPDSTGSFALTAIATDNQGAISELSAAVNVTVADAPTETPTPTATPTVGPGTPTPTPTTGPGTPTPTPTTGPGTPTPTPTTTTTPGSATPTPTVNPVASIGFNGNALGAPGSAFLLTGSGFTPGAEVRLYINGGYLGAVNADGSGNFLLEIMTTGDTPQGEYTVTVAGSTGLNATFSVHPSGQMLPVSGAGQQLAVPDLIYLPVSAK